MALFTVLTGAAAAVALLANMVFGALSDRTRSRFGARTPWIGSALGAVTGAVFLEDPEHGLPVVAGLLVALAVAAVLVAPDHSNSDTAGERLDLRALAGAFRLPRHAPDFYWALWGRLLLVLGYFMINGFQLYIFTDYVGLDGNGTAHAIAVTSVLFLVTALAGAVVAGPLSDRLHRRKAFVIGSSALAICAVLALAASSLLVGLGLGFVPVFVGAIIAGALGAACIPPIRSVR